MSKSFFTVDISVSKTNELIFTGVFPIAIRNVSLPVIGDEITYLHESDEFENYYVIGKGVVIEKILFPGDAPDILESLFLAVDEIYQFQIAREDLYSGGKFSLERFNQWKKET